MTLRVLIDESLPRSVGAALSAAGLDVVDARDVGLSGAADPSVFAHAQQDTRVILSRDVDFADIMAYPIGTHHGIVVARLPNEVSMSALGSLLVRALDGLEAQDVRGCLLIVEEHRVRTRRPP